MTTFSLKNILSQKSKDILDKVKANDEKVYSNRKPTKTKSIKPQKVKKDIVPKVIKKKQTKRERKMREQIEYERKFICYAINRMKGTAPLPAKDKKKKHRVTPYSNRERVAKFHHGSPIETTSSVKAISIPMGGQNRRY